MVSYFKTSQWVSGSRHSDCHFVTAAHYSKCDNPVIVTDALLVTQSLLLHNPISTVDIKENISMVVLQPTEVALKELFWNISAPLTNYFLMPW